MRSTDEHHRIHDVFEESFNNKIAIRTVVHAKALMDKIAKVKYT